jgi:hypothetical protein
LVSLRPRSNHEFESVLRLGHRLIAVLFLWQTDPSKLLWVVSMRCGSTLVDLLSSSASPFWRPPPRESTSMSGKKPARESSGLVVGAAYSHADMLKFDSMRVLPQSCFVALRRLTSHVGNCRLALDLDPELPRLPPLRHTAEMPRHHQPPDTRLAGHRLRSRLT